MQNKHLIDIYTQGERIGFGLRLERTFALTAAHLLHRKFGPDVAKDLPPLHLQDGTEVSLVFCNTPSDLARLRIELNGTRDPLQNVGFSRVRKGEAWRATASPVPDKPLSGKVVEPNAEYYRDEHRHVKAMRLRCEGQIDDHAAYAGSPIEPEPQKSPPVVLGMLVESRGSHRLENNEAFAVSMAEMFRLLGSEKQPSANRSRAGYIHPQWTRPGPNRNPRKGN
ncbi:hypothetical protein [Streptomyces hokutonensis]|uniref:Uncharacterized protein n=1 Tax=Streptomyces hokutonensis TaxID=1306990 RepID=A0ABW6MGV5_9ACTN